MHVCVGLEPSNNVLRTMSGYQNLPLMIHSTTFGHFTDINTVHPVDSPASALRILSIGIAYPLQGFTIQENVISNGVFFIKL